MIIKSNQVRTITIEGVKFTPDVKGVEVPDSKIKALRDNFFFKALVKDGSFSEIKEETKPTAAELAKAERDALVAEATALELEFPKNLGIEKLKALIEESKAD